MSAISSARSRGGASGRLQTPCLALLLSCISLTLGLGLLTTATVANALPPGWGYELISPAETGGGDVSNAIGSADDQHAWAASVLPLSSRQGTGNLDVFAASRTSSGWQLQDLAEPFPADGKSYSYILTGRSPDASHSLLSVCERAAVGCAGGTRYVRVGSDGTRTTELTVPNPGFGQQRAPLLVASSSDLSRIVVQEAAPPLGVHLVAQDTHTQGNGLYLAHDGQAEFLGVDENGAALDCGAVLGNGNAAGFEQSGLSADGQTVAFTSPDPVVGCPETPEVYVHHDGHTFDISRPRNGNADEGATWIGGSQDGSTVFFTTTSQLVASDTDTANDIYAYHVATDTVTRHTPGAEVQSVQVSPDGDYIYFTALNPIGGQGTLGQGNLYLYHNGTISFITSAPNNAISVGDRMTLGDPSLATPDGHYLLFYSTAALVGPPTDGNSQLFQYSTVDHQIRCISCHTDGTAPTTSTLLPGNAAEPFRAAVDLRMQSDDGQTVVFETHERLLPEDENNTLDIYLWQHGTLSLISDPRVEDDVGSLASTTATGDTVYFKSNARLTPDAQQDNTKMYAARLGGGFSFPPPAPACQDDACQGPPTAPPNSPPPTSTTLGGLGNLIPAPAPPVTKPAVKPLTNAQKLSRALKACRSKRRGSARHRCESHARHRYPQAARRATHRHRGGTADASH